MTTVISLITLALTIAWGVVKYFHGKAYQRRKAWDEFKDLETKHREALAAGDPWRVSVIAKRMRELRAKYRFTGL